MRHPVVIVSLFCVLLFSGCSNPETDASIPEVIKAGEIEIQGSLPEFSRPMLRGGTLTSSSLSGKITLINFWATWCAPCRREIPLLKSTQANYGENNMQVIGIAVDDLESVQIYAEEANFNYPILVGQEDAMAAAEASGVPFIGLPFTLIVAPGGELLKSYVGEIVKSHIDTILEVFEQLEAGEIDLAGARSALDAL